MPFQSDAIVEGPALCTGLPSTTLPRFIRDLARQAPERIALVDHGSGRSYTYGAVDRLIGRCAAGLAAQGLRRGDTLLMFAPNVPEWPIVALGALAAGGVVSGANPMYGAGDLAHQMRDANARFVFTVPAFLVTVREAAAAAGCDRIILLGDADGTVSLATLVACEDPEPEGSDDPDALAALPYSSGTTGTAKGVMLTHRMILANVHQCLDVFPMSESAVVLAFLPMFHIFGFTVAMLCGLAARVKLVTVPRFEPESFVEAIEAHRVSHLFVVPPVMQFLAMHPLIDAHDCSSVQAIVCGAAPLGAALECKVAERMRCKVAQGFGMTEASGCVTASLDEIRGGSSGRLVPGTQGRVVDPATGTDLPRGTPGELWYRGPQVFKGYLNRPEATAETITADGWVRSGDIGYFDDDGFLYVTDRLKELIKVKGFQVPPAELEALLITHPSISDVAVIGRPDERAGELPVAYVVARVALDPEAIKAWVAERVPAYKQLCDVVICEAIPKNPSGKILRRVLRAQDAVRATG